MSFSVKTLSILSSLSWSARGSGARAWPRASAGSSSPPLDGWTACGDLTGRDSHGTLGILPAPGAPEREEPCRRHRLVVAIAAAAGCAPRYVDGRRPQTVAERVAARHRASPATSSSISVDGLRPDAIGERETPFLFRMMQTGSYSLTARRSCRATRSRRTRRCSRASRRSGTTSRGTTFRRRSSTPWRCRRSSASRGLAAIEPRRSSARPNSTRCSASARSITLRRRAAGSASGRAIGRSATSNATWTTSRPNLLFVHLSDPDTAGHDKGWMTDEYRGAVAVADAAVGRVVAAADAAYGAGNYSVIVSADHGGHDKGHGTDDPRDVTIPWIAWGKGVRPVAPAARSRSGRWTRRRRSCGCLAFRSRPTGSGRPSSKRSARAGRARDDTRRAAGNTVGSPICRHARSTRRSPRDRRFRRSGSRRRARRPAATFVSSSAAAASAPVGSTTSFSRSHR